VAIHNRHDFHPFPRLVAPISAPPRLAITKLASMKHTSFVQRAPFAKLVGYIHQNPTQNIAATPALKAVRVALRPTVQQPFLAQSFSPPYDAVRPLPADPLGQLSQQLNGKLSQICPNF
jgi:hypothetical protein